MSEAGGTNAGGNGPCSPGEFDADPGLAFDCVPFETCRPGQYVLLEGSTISNRECEDCPAFTYSDTENQAECRYSGCLFSERAVVASTSSRAAECEPDPDYDAVPGQTSSSAGGLAALGQGVQAASVVLGDPYETSLSSYRAGTRTGQRQLALREFERPVSLGLAPDGSVYLSGIEEITLARWAHSFPAAGDEWELAAARSYHPECGFATHGTEGLFWSVAHRQDAGFALSIERFTHPGPPTAAPNAILNVTFVSGVAMDPLGAVWVVKGAFGEAELVRYDLQTGAPQKVPGVDSNVAEVVATETGVAYAVTYGYDPELTFRVHEVGADAQTRTTWTWQGTTMAGIPKAIAVDPGRAVYVAGICWDSDELTTDLDACVTRIDRRSGQIETRSFVGPWEDRADYIAVTTEGEVYISGVTHESPETRRFRAYVRRVLF